MNEGLNFKLPVLEVFYFKELVIGTVYLNLHKPILFLSYNLVI